MHNSKSLVVTASTDSPVISVEDMADFLRVTGGGQNALIATYIGTATESVKQHLQRAIKTQTFVYRMDGFFDGGGDEALVRLGAGYHVGSRDYIVGGSGSIQLPMPPLQSVTSITTYNTSDTSSVFSSASYGLDLQGGRIYLNDGYTWPTSLRDYNAVEIEYVAGYGSGSVPEPILQAIRLHVAGLFDGCYGMTEAVTALLAPYKIMDQSAWS